MVCGRLSVIGASDMACETETRTPNINFGT